MNPIELLYSWQPLLIAGIVIGLTQFIKASIDAKMGQESRKKNPWISRVFLPALNPLFGFIVAMVIPTRPEALIAYVDAHTTGMVQALLVYGAWGAAIGQFADYIFTKGKEARQGFRRSE
jgi:hypothetical protein